jgi:hypothetical protein
MLNILEEIRSTSSKNQKIALLAKHKDNQLFRRVLEMTYSPLIKFGIKKIPEPISLVGERITLNTALDEVMRLAKREITGNSGQAHLSNLLANMDAEDAEVLKLVLGKSLKIGCEAGSINSAFGKGFIKEAPYQGAVSYNSERVISLFNKYRTVFSQVKVDGRYANVAIDGDSVQMESRQGLPNYFGDSFDFLLGLDSFYGEPLVLSGELIIPGVDRYTSNGIVSALVSIGNKIIEGEDVNKELAKFLKEYKVSYEQMRDRLQLIVWDFIPMSVYTTAKTWGESYGNRLAILTNMIEQINNPRIKLVESIVVSKPSEAMAHFLECRDRGEEGTILKGDAHWQDGKPTHQVKFKHEITLDLVVESGNFGTIGTKNENVISSINVRSEDGLLVASPGGMSEKEMLWVTQNIDQLKGSIVSVKSNGVSKDRNGNYSLLHPVVLFFREDKNTGNTLSECIEIDESTKSLGEGDC